MACEDHAWEDARRILAWLGRLIDDRRSVELLPLIPMAYSANPRVDEILAAIQRLLEALYRELIAGHPGDTSLAALAVARRLTLSMQSSALIHIVERAVQCGAILLDNSLSTGSTMLSAGERTAVIMAQLRAQLFIE